MYIQKGEWATDNSSDLGPKTYISRYKHAPSPPSHELHDSDGNHIAMDNSMHEA